MGTSVQNFFTSRDNNVDPATYVGQLDRLWYNPDTNQIFISDGVTPGGRPVDLGANANALINTLTVSNITGPTGTVALIGNINISQLLQAASGNITGNLVIGGNISPATEVKIGGVRAGPGANISNTGLLTIDTTGLPLSFGNFTANNNILTIVNSDEDMILATQGDAEIQLVGNIGFYKSNGLPPDPNNLFFFARDDGQILILVPNTDPLLGAVEIVGSSSGNSVSPALAGVMLHITGQTGEPSSIYNDGVNDNPNFIGRRYNGNATAPTQVLSGDEIVRFSGQGYSSTVGFNAPADGTISLDALEDFTESNQGAIWRFLVNPVGGNVRQQVANISVANGVTATKFVTSGTVEATGNITGGNLTTGAQVVATGNVTGGNLITGGVISATGNITGANITATANIADSKGDVRSIPINTQNTGYTLQASDAGKVVNMTTGNVTVPAGVFASPFGQAITIYNDQNASNAVVSSAGVTLRLAGTAATGNRTLARYGLATVVCVSANTFVISGAGLT